MCSLGRIDVLGWPVTKGGGPDAPSAPLAMTRLANAINKVNGGGVAYSLRIHIPVRIRRRDCGKCQQKGTINNRFVSKVGRPKERTPAARLRIANRRPRRNLALCHEIAKVGNPPTAAVPEPVADRRPPSILSGYSLQAMATARNAPCGPSPRRAGRRGCTAGAVRPAVSISRVRSEGDLERVSPKRE
jgi:hypothetical protein